MNKQISLFISILVLTTIIGCATADVLLKIKLDNTKEQIIDIMGKPDVARGSVRNKYDQVIEVWEYVLTKNTKSESLKPEPAVYWLYFMDGKLIQWGEAGDWQKEADRIYEMRFK